MSGFEDHPQATGLEDVRQRVGNLLSEALLNLEAPGEMFDEPWNLRKAHQAARRNVSHVGLTEEGQEVMLTEAVERDVLDENQRLRWIVEDAAVQYIR